MAKTKTKRKNWSKSPDLETMTEAVEVFDLYRLGKPKENILISDYWKKHLKGKIPFNTFRTYASVDIFKRTPLGTQVGPRSNKAKLADRAWKDQLKRAKEKQESLVLGSHYRWLAGMRLNLSQAQKDYQLESEHLQQQENLSQDQMMYQRLSLDRHVPRTPAEKKWQYELCKHVLPRHCATIGANGDFLKEELWLLSQCYKTFGFAQVSYKGPTIDETVGHNDGKAETVARRMKMKSELRAFKLIQVRHSLTMLNSGAGRPALMITLDVLLKKYDEELEQLGLSPSELRGQLREANDNRREDLRQMRNNGKRMSMNLTGKEDPVPNIEELDISSQQRMAACRKIRAEIGQEEAALTDEGFVSKGLNASHQIQAEMGTEGDKLADDDSDEEYVELNFSPASHQTQADMGPEGDKLADDDSDEEGASWEHTISQKIQAKVNQGQTDLADTEWMKKPRK